MKQDLNLGLIFKNKCFINVIPYIDNGIYKKTTTSTTTITVTKL